ncbi:Retrovirus-related Pol polyprotein from transposon 412 [Araneus ventricosus]|uniref:RNA-directed DNA polymerase n=1 Tax=Araneus ventricosus TaxID=182803 RepID=A0A4Y2VUL0_ARAVE|nr:Retrovirus-related Pol polyprotein from transposon 412 [Araneus ventricosus]
MRSDDIVNVMYRENFPRFSQNACAQRFFNSEKAMQGNKIRRQIAFAELRSATSSVGSRHDIIIVGRTFEEHANKLRKVFQRLQKTNLELNRKKCRFFQKEVAYLGHVIQQKELKPIQKKIKAAVDWPRPDKIHDLRSFLGLCTYYRRFVKHFSTIARPLHKLTEAKSNFNWTDECEKSFNILKQALTSAPILTYHRIDKDLILDTDAGNEGIGAVMSQNIGNEERVIAYSVADFDNMRPEAQNNFEAPSRKKTCVGDTNV